LIPEILETGLLKILQKCMIALREIGGRGQFRLRRGDDLRI
jgi:hypothetical protein